MALVDGASFVVSSPSGDIHPDQPQGLFVRDTRVLSKLSVEVDGQPLNVVSSVPRGPFAVSIVSRAHHSAYPHHADVPLTVLRHRSVGPGLHEELEVQNHSIHPVELTLSVAVDADFASLFDVKADVQDPDVTARIVGVDGRLQLRSSDRSSEHHGLKTWVNLEPPPDDRVGDRSSWDLALAPGEAYSLVVEVWAGPDASEDDRPDVFVREDRAERALRVARDPADGVRVITADRRLERATVQSLDDLAILRIFDPDHADRVVVAAGAPWFMALFGRDSILTAWMALIADHRLAAGVLQELADGQGRKEVMATEEQPGRILHEVRYDRRSVGVLGGSGIYYGTVDATPLFVMLVAEYLRWSNDWALVERLMPAVDAALSWIEDYGDRDGDGFVEYQRNQETGLANQGWKDSWDGVRYGDGRVAEAPIALCEVQAYVYGAYRARSYLAEVAGAPAVASEWSERADGLQAAFDKAFWLPELGTYAIGLDAEKRPIDSVSSNVGHCLWAGIVPTERAPQVVLALTSPAMSSGWGLRTLAADNPAFNPLSYHCGSVWPHDTAMAIAGLSRYGFASEAAVLSSNLLDAAEAYGGRLPELFAGFDRAELPAPVAYPASCSPQAWAAASTLLLIRSMVGLEPDLPRGRVAVRRSVGDGRDEFRAEGIALGQSRVTLTTGAVGTGIDGLASSVFLDRS